MDQGRFWHIVHVKGTSGTSLHH